MSPLHGFPVYALSHLTKADRTAVSAAQSQFMGELGGISQTPRVSFCPPEIPSSSPGILFDATGCPWRPHQISLANQRKPSEVPSVEASFHIRYSWPQAGSTSAGDAAVVRQCGGDAAVMRWRVRPREPGKSWLRLCCVNSRVHPHLFLSLSIDHQSFQHPDSSIHRVI